VQLLRGLRHPEGADDERCGGIACDFGTNSGDDSGDGSSDNSSDGSSDNFSDDAAGWRRDSW
jgi:hypothetical protein